MEQEKYLSEQEFDTNKHCAICRCNGTVRKHNYYFSQNRKARVCVHCALKFSFSQDIIAWLETNAIYGPTGKLTNFKLCIPKAGAEPTSSLAELNPPLTKGVEINEQARNCEANAARKNCISNRKTNRINENVRGGNKWK
jgi:hypothetical protein